MAMNKEFKWAVKTLLDLCNIPANPGNLQAFENPGANSQWIHAVIKRGMPQVGAMNSSVYDKIINILEANGVPVNPYLPGNG